MFRWLCILFLACGVFHSKSEAQDYSDTVVTVYFPSGKSSPGFRENAKLLAALDNLHFTINRISGFTDSVGSAEKNLLLSRKRSENISRFLQLHFNLAQNGAMENHGEQNPASLTDNSLNRRVEISLRLTENRTARLDSGKLSLLKTYPLSKLYFRPDEAVLEPSSMPYLDNVANILKTYTSGIFEIRGHVNWTAPPAASADSGYKKKMDELSTARARLVYEILIDKGIPQERMRYKGMGNSQMLYPNAGTDEEKRKNMRVEILILTKQKQTH